MTLYVKTGGSYISMGHIFWTEGRLNFQQWLMVFKLVSDKQKNKAHPISSVDMLGRAILKP